MPGPHLTQALQPYSFDSFYTMWNLCCYVTINKLTHISLSANLLYDFLDDEGDQEQPTIAALTALSAELARLCEHFEHNVVREYFWPLKTADNLIANSSDEINATRWKPYTPEVWDQLFKAFRPEFKQQVEQMTLLVGRMAQQSDTLEADAASAETLRIWRRLVAIAVEKSEEFTTVLDDAEIDYEVEAYLGG